jgi:hypothetical protein
MSLASYLTVLYSLYAFAALCDFLVGRRGRRLIPERFWRFRALIFLGAVCWDLLTACLWPLHTLVEFHAHLFLRQLPADAGATITAPPVQSSHLPHVAASLDELDSAMNELAFTLNGRRATNNRSAADKPTVVEYQPPPPVRRRHIET